MKLIELALKKFGLSDDVNMGYDSAAAGYLLVSVFLKFVSCVLVD